MATLLVIGKVIVLLFAVILIFNLMILVHEWGHFLAARWRGLKIEKFQIWFGKPIWKKTINGVQYGLGTIPFGGFVALPQMAPMDTIEGRSDHAEPLPRISPLDKIIVAIAGPLFSFLLALFFAVIVWGVGKPVGALEKTTAVGWVDPAMPGAAAGFQIGDEILAVNGVKVNGWEGAIDSVRERIVHSKGEEIEFLVRRGEEEITLKSGFTIQDTAAFERKAFRDVGIDPALEAVHVGSVIKDSPAEIVGMKAGDRIVEINGKPVHSIGLVSAEIRAAEGKVRMVVERGKQQMTFEVTPVSPLSPEGTKPSIGIAFDVPAKFTIEHPNPITETVASGKMIFRTLDSLTDRQSDVSVTQMSGVVGIGGLYYRFLDNPEWGLRMALWFSIVLNVNLALLNMLPFPVLDGGHITLALVDIIRRRPVKSPSLEMKVLEYVQAGCALLLFGFMIFITIFDTRDQIPGKANTMTFDRAQVVKANGA